MKDLLPNPVRMANYPDALSFVPFGTYLRNTLFLCFATVIGAVLSSAIIAYGFSQIKFKGRDFLFLLMISSMALPAQVTMIPKFYIFAKLGWYNTYLPLIVPMFLGVPFFVFLITMFYKTIPAELVEAARIDGCSEWRILFTIFIPLSIPVLATCSLFQFMWQWNDFFSPLLYINDPQKYPLAYGLQQFLCSYGSRWTYLMAASTVFTLPIIFLFALTQKTFIQGVATTGIKG
jgi:multiple sugar transport system permease protein